jgi:hypothetical protein
MDARVNGIAGAFELICGQIADPEAQWSLGTFGAIAEFMRDADEPAEIARTTQSISVVTPRGGMRLEALPGLRPIAFETITTSSWSQRIAFCLPAAASAMNRRAVLTEIGSDVLALRAEDRDALLFDLGLAAAQVDCCVRTADTELIAGLRAQAGRSLFESGNPAMGLILLRSPHRVFMTRAGRAEVYQPIPAHGGVSPEGPHTHVLPKLLAHGRTHAATEPIPSGWVSCAHLYPAHPLRDGHGRARSFDAGRHAAFQRLLTQYGDPQHIRLKQEVMSALAAGAGPSSIAVPGTRFARALVRVALRQFPAGHVRSSATDAWLATYDGPAQIEADRRERDQPGADPLP